MNRARAFGGGVGAEANEGAGGCARGERRRALPTHSRRASLYFRKEPPIPNGSWPELRRRGLGEMQIQAIFLWPEPGFPRLQGNVERHHRLRQGSRGALDLCLGVFRSQQVYFPISWVALCTVVDNHPARQESASTLAGSSRHSSCSRIDTGGSDSVSPEKTISGTVDEVIGGTGDASKNVHIGLEEEEEEQGEAQEQELGEDLQKKIVSAVCN